MEVINRFKTFDVVERVSEELWTEVGNIVQEVVTKPPPQINAIRHSDYMRKLYK